MLVLLLLGKMASLIEIENIVADYRPISRKAIRALNGVSLSLASNEVLGLFGLNGAGKTTLIRVILGMIKPREGKIDVLGLNPFTAREKILAQLGVVLEGERHLEARLKADDILQLVGAGYGLRPKEIKKRADELFYRFRLEPNRSKLITQYSRGMRQKLSLILAMLHKPKVVVLDEPIIALDVESTHEFMSLIREIADSGCGVIISSHQINTISNLIDSAVILRGGQTIFQDSVKKLIETVGQGRYRITFKKETEIHNLPKSVYFENDSFFLEANTKAMAEFFTWAHTRSLVLDRLEPIQDLESAFLKISYEAGSK